jgi:GTP cyclohydrolase I
MSSTIDHGAVERAAAGLHHRLPFHGVAHVGYRPGERIIGLSKLGRVVELFARDLQLQELTGAIHGI